MSIVVEHKLITLRIISCNFTQIGCIYLLRYMGVLLFYRRNKTGF